MCIRDRHTLESVTSGIAVTPINKGDTHMAMPEVPEGYEIEFVGADYEQIIGADRTCLLYTSRCV